MDLNNTSKKFSDYNDKGLYFRNAPSDILQGSVLADTILADNHKNVFGAAGCAVRTYPYYDAATRGVDLDAMCAALEKVPAGDVVLLHVC